MPFVTAIDGVAWQPVFNAGSATVLLVLLGYIGIWWVRGAPDRRKARTEADGSLRADLLQRIRELEEKHDRERREDRDACEKTTDELRQRIREQDKLIDGLQRQLIMFQVATGRALPMSEHSPEIQRMMATLQGIYTVEEKPKSETLRAAEETSHAAEITVEQIKQDEIGKDGE